jgi:hypothetical protein
MDDKGQAIARQDNYARANIPARHFEADTPAFDRQEKAIVPSMQFTMKVEKIYPNGKSDSLSWGSLLMSSTGFISMAKSLLLRK